MYLLYKMSNNSENNCLLLTLGQSLPQDLLLSVLELPIISHNSLRRGSFTFYLPLYVLCLFVFLCFLYVWQEPSLCSGEIIFHTWGYLVWTSICSNKTSTWATLSKYNTLQSLVWKHVWECEILNLYLWTLMQSQSQHGGMWLAEWDLHILMCPLWVTLNRGSVGK